MGSGHGGKRDDSSQTGAHFYESELTEAVVEKIILWCTKYDWHLKTACSNFNVSVYSFTYYLRQKNRLAVLDGIRYKPSAGLVETAQEEMKTVHRIIDPE